LPWSKFNYIINLQQFHILVEREPVPVAHHDAENVIQGRSVRQFQPGTAQSVRYLLLPAFRQLADYLMQPPDMLRAGTPSAPTAQLT
jgi:hypothetical protein